MDFEPGAVGKGKKFGFVEKSVEVFNDLWFEFVVEDEDMHVFLILKAAFGKSFNDTWIPSSKDHFSEQVLGVKAVGVKNLKIDFLVLVRLEVFRNECGLAGCCSQDDGSGLSGELDRLDFAVDLMVLKWEAEYVLNDFTESAGVRWIEPWVESLVERMVNGFLLFSI